MNLSASPLTINKTEPFRFKNILTNGNKKK